MLLLRIAVVLRVLVGPWLLGRLVAEAGAAVEVLQPGVLVRVTGLGGFQEGA